MDSKCLGYAPSTKRRTVSMSRHWFHSYSLSSFFLFHVFFFVRTLNNQFEQYLFGIKFNSRSHVYLTVFNALSLLLSFFPLYMSLIGWCECVYLPILLAMRSYRMAWIFVTDTRTTFYIPYTPRTHLDLSLSLSPRMLLCLTISRTSTKFPVDLYCLKHWRANIAIGTCRKQNRNNKKEMASRFCCVRCCCAVCREVAVKNIMRKVNLL